MNLEKAIRELDEICEFLNGHTGISRATYALTHTGLTVTVESAAPLPGLKIWTEQLVPGLQAILKKPVRFQINTGTKQPSAATAEKNELASVHKKLIGKVTYLFSSFDSKYRLLRIEPDKKNYDASGMYFESSSEIAEIELRNINQLFQIAARDHRAGKFIRNIIEMNINCAANPEIMTKFGFAFRQIPKQLSDRFIISLVRVHMQDAADSINTSINAFRQLISPVFISLELEICLTHRLKMNDIQSDGFVITVGNPQRKDIVGLTKKANLTQLEKEVLLLYYTGDWKEIPSLETGLTPMYLKSKISN